MDKEAVGMGDLLALINDYGRACRRDGNPAWESDEGRALKAALAHQPASQAGLTDEQIEEVWNGVEWKDLSPVHEGFEKALRLRFARAIERALLSRAAPSVQQAEPDGIACSSCGLTMQQSRMLAEQPAEEARGVDGGLMEAIRRYAFLFALHTQNNTDASRAEADAALARVRALLAAPAARKEKGHG